MKALVALTLVAGIGLWLWRRWWPRQCALWAAPGPAARSGLARLAGLWGHDPLSPITHGISPLRPILGEAGRRFVQGRWRTNTLIYGPPRTGKTKGLLIPTVMSWTGVVVVTSTRPDVLEACAPIRAERGGVWVADPFGSVRQLPPGVRRFDWSPLRGCRSWDVAHLRGAALTCTVGEGVSDPNHWRQRAGQLLGALLHAAALDGRGVSELMRWVRTNDASEAAQILGEREAGPALGLLHQALPSGKAGNTGERDSIWSALTGALSAFDNAAVTARADAAVEADFDPIDFLGGANALFVVAPSDASSDIAPFVVGLVEEIRVAALRICDTQPAAALPIPLLLALDEVVNIAPLPALPAILRECGGRNIVTVLVVQNLVAADRRWGRDFGSRELFDLCGSKLVLPGVGDHEALTAISAVCGSRWVERGSRSVHRHRHWELLSHVWPRWPAMRTSISTQTQLEERPLYTPGEIRQLPRGHVLALVENGPPRILRIRDFDRLQPFRAWAHIGHTAAPWWRRRLTVRLRAALLRGRRQQRPLGQDAPGLSVVRPGELDLEVWGLAGDDRGTDDRGAA